MVPLFVQEVRKAARADVDQLVEDRWDDSLSLNLEVERCLVRKAQEFFHQEARALLEDRVDDGEDEARVALFVVLIHQNLVLNVEVADVVV